MDSARRARSCDLLCTGAVGAPTEPLCLVWEQQPNLGLLAGQCWQWAVGPKQCLRPQYQGEEMSSGVPVLLRAPSCGSLGWECRESPELVDSCAAFHSISHIGMRGCRTAAPGPGSGSQGKGCFPHCCVPEGSGAWKGNKGNEGNILERR